MYFNGLKSLSNHNLTDFDSAGTVFA
jgi:hypothetical protein